MKRLHLGAVIAWLILSCGVGMAAPLATAGRNVIPKQTQQIICVDYRALRASSAAMAMKDRVVPSNIKEFESALRSLGLDPEKDVETITFASFRTGKTGLQLIGIAQGQFSTKQVLRRYRLKKIQPQKYHLSYVYPTAAGLQMTFLDDFTMLFGGDNAIRSALDARDGYIESLSSNSQLSDMINSAGDGAVWSVLDQRGTQTMMRSALGDASQITDYNVVKKRLLGSYYALDFSNGVKFDLNVLTSDAITAGTFSAAIKAGMLYRRFSSTGADKMAMEDMSVESDSSNLRVHFSASDNQFQKLMQSELFAAVSH